MYRKLFAVLFIFGLLCPTAFALTEKEMNQKFSAAAEKAAASAAASSKDSMKDNMLLTMSFSERGVREAEKEVYETHVKLHGPDWTVPEMIDGYAYNRFFVYKALPSEIKDGSAQEEDGSYLLYSEKLLPNRKLIRAFAVYTGVKKTPRYEGRIGCKAYALGPQWVITSGTCPIKKYDESPIIVYDETYNERTDREIENFSIDGTKIKNPEYFSNGNVWLIYIPKEGNQNLINALSNKRPLKILGFSKPEHIFTLAANGQFYVHTSRYGALVSDKTKAKLRENSLEGTLFKASSSFNGTATDPFFYVKNGEEYLTAYNAAPERYHLNVSKDELFQSSWSGKSSNKYTILTLDDLQFIKNTIQKYNPASWTQLKSRMFIDNPRQLFK